MKKVIQSQSHWSPFSFVAFFCSAFGEVALTSFAWHPKEENRLLVASVQSQVKDLYVYERIPMVGVALLFYCCCVFFSCFVCLFNSYFLQSETKLVQVQSNLPLMAICLVRHTCLVFSTLQHLFCVATLLVPRVTALDSLDWRCFNRVLKAL
jgi:hypothetical protein